MALAVCVGDNVGTTSLYEAGEGVHVRNGQIYALVVGVRDVKEDPSSGKQVISVLNASAKLIVPKQGDIVIVKITRLLQNAVHGIIMCVGKQTVDQNFKGIIRLQDVRATEIDKVVLADSFRPSDIVRAEILSLGDARSYYLTTARDELGVVHARSAAGASMIAVGWEEMRCPESYIVEKRKVAKS
uniref:S1 motif domain-containing protein n=1 Tax=Polytomella parva TaxID=51329 RepID=A0A7S0UPN2_9CHLO